jgi:putative salt-induced outer membrane protein
METPGSHGRAAIAAWPCLAFVAALAGAAPASAAPLASPIQAMIETAFSDGDEAVIAAVLATAKKTAPDSVKEIDGLEARYRRSRAAAKAAQARAEGARLASASWLALWSGELELGGSQSTGSTRDTEAHLGVKLDRTGLRWLQKLNVQADYGSAAGAKTADRIDATFQSQFTFRKSAYAYGLAEYERDAFLGYQDRYTVGVGVGVAPIDRPGLKLQLDIGSAIRYALYDQRTNESEVAARGSVSLAWTLRPGLKLSEEGALYIDRAHTTARSTLALDTDLFGPLKARLSYSAQFERDEPDNHGQLDTISRATVAYDF